MRIGRQIGLIAVSAMLLACTGERSEAVRIVGSSTVFPFAAKAAETYSGRSGIGMVVEQTGSGGGHKLFCSGDPSIAATTSSRPQKPSETALCGQNGVAPIIELQLGYDGIVLARATGAQSIALSAAQLYRALASQLPASARDCTPVANPYQSWSDIDAALPKERIEVHGPPPTSGTRDAFVETAMEAGARDFPCLAAIEKQDPDAFRSRAHELREDGHWVNAGENDNALVRTLTNSPSALGIFGYSFLDQNKGKVRGVAINGVTPDADSIRSGDYPIVRGLYLYIREDAAAPVAGFAREIVSDEAAGEDGYLEEMGLIPLQTQDRRVMQKRVAARTEAGQ